MSDLLDIGFKYVIVISLIIIGVDILNDAIYAFNFNLNHVKKDLLRVILTIILLYFFCTGYKWAKYITLLCSFFGGIMFVHNGLPISMGTTGFPPIIGVILLASGLTYLIVFIFILASSHIRYFFNNRRLSIKEKSK